MILQARLRELLNYDPDTGVFSWRTPVSNRVKVGDVCSCLTRTGHVVIRLDGTLYYAQRLAWLWAHGRMPGRLRYLDKDITNNRLSNIEEASTEVQPKRKQRANNRPHISDEEWLRRFAEAHGDRYDYAGAEFDGAMHKVRIQCAEHGAFLQAPTSHAKGRGCVKCANKLSGNRQASGPAKLLQSFRAAHGDRFDYSETRGSRVGQKVEIRCKEHGVFSQVASDHAGGHGCPRCAVLSDPQANQDIAAFITGLGFEVLREYPLFGDRRSVDVFVPAKNLAIEHNGLIWHSERFHADPKRHLRTKLQDATAQGVKLLHLFSDEWTGRRAACEAMIRHSLGVAPRINARGCTFELLDGKDAEAVALLNGHHIQGASPCAAHAVLRHKGAVVMVAAFRVLRSSRKNTDATKWELTRMASSAQVRGGASKLMKHFVAAHPEIRHITTYYDRRLFSGGAVYGHMGFVKVKTYGPDYAYVRGQNRLHKCSFQKPRIAAKFGIDVGGKTEREAMAEVGYPRIWDCGKDRFEWVRV